LLKPNIKKLQSSKNKKPKNYFKHSYDAWNREGAVGVEYTPEFIVSRPALPSDVEMAAQTAGDVSLQVRPIAPGSGIPFVQALGGNWPNEQFTSEWELEIIKNKTHKSYTY
jgi:hypothetical protein